MKLKLLKKLFLTTAGVFVITLTLVFVLMSVAVSDTFAKDRYSALSNSCDIVAESLISDGVLVSNSTEAVISSLAKVNNIDLFVSDAIGYQKPTKEFFEGCFCKIPKFSKEETIIIGDSLSSDIKGGCQVGIKTCWYNPKKLQNNTEFKADYEITSLDEIKNIL